MKQWWNETNRADLKFWRKPCPTATMSTTNPTWTGLGFKSRLFLKCVKETHYVIRIFT